MRRRDSCAVDTETCQCFPTQGNLQRSGHQTNKLSTPGQGHGAPDLSRAQREMRNKMQQVPAQRQMIIRTDAKARVEPTEAKAEYLTVGSYSDDQEVNRVLNAPSLWVCAPSEVTAAESAASCSIIWNGKRGRLLNTTAKASCNRFY